MAQKRQRAPGGGRKPGKLGLRSANLSLRLPPALRAALVAAKTKNKRRSVSEEIVQRLNSSLDQDRDETDRPRHIRALMEAVALIALGLEEAWTKRPWNDDRYTQEQLSKGIDLLLYTYSRGEVVIPPEVSAQAARNPEDRFFIERLGEMVAGGIISSARAAGRRKPPSREELRLMEQGSPPMYYPESWRLLWELDQGLSGFTAAKPPRRKT